ncbi:MAG: GFA family protein [Sorangiineae bacterium]|nr:GFA family protein [Polyangiaceae bacterium]MEB2321779.1 GFA family protein [Sorangiineae bacterium]
MTDSPLIECACHCHGCQRMSSSAFSLTAICAASGFEVMKGSPVIGGLRDPALQHFFCGDCMTWMFTRPAALPQVVNVRPTLLDERAWFAPFMETYTSTRLPWAQTGAVRSFEAFPPMNTFNELLEEYRSWRAARR